MDIYTLENTKAAYQLNWSVSIFPITTLPPHESWFDELQQVTETDGVRILELRTAANRAVQFLTSTRPDIPPSQIIRSVKGRLQYLVRKDVPKAFRRNYRIESVGSADRSTIENYVCMQPKRHPMADLRFQQILQSVQIELAEVDLSLIRYSAHGQFIHNLHAVLAYETDWYALDAKRLVTARSTIESVCADHGFLISRGGIVPTHVHLALGCGVGDAPGDVAISFLNALARADGMQPVCKFGFYVGTFGNFDLGAIRHGRA
jgi:REP element-mobilizing transposase RayT